MKRKILIAFMLGALVLLGAACGAAQRPAIGTPGQPSLVYFYTEA